jgi:hypothetical protein
MHARVGKYLLVSNPGCTLPRGACVPHLCLGGSGCSWAKPRRRQDGVETKERGEATYASDFGEREPVPAPCLTRRGFLARGKRLVPCLTRHVFFITGFQRSQLVYPDSLPRVGFPRNGQDPLQRSHECGHIGQHTVPTPILYVQVQI